MHKSFLLAVAGTLALVTPAFAQDADVVHSETTVNHAADGSYHRTTAQERTDGQGNAVRVETGVHADPYGNAQVSKTVKHEHSDAYGTSKAVTEHTVDTNGAETTHHVYEENRQP